MRVVAEIDYVEMPGDFKDIPSTLATCTRCSNEVWAYGESEASVKRCLVELRETCPQGERNFYVTDED
jgi:hypothetical protein